MHARAWIVMAWLCAGCGGSGAGASCKIDDAGECASGYCVSFTCSANDKDATVCTRRLCGDGCPAGDFCLEFASGNKHCIPESACN